MVRLFILYAILIFAKKAPKLISNLLNLNKDGEGIGLKGLNIKNKMGEAALVGDKVKGGMNKLEGRTKGAVGGGLAGFMNTKGDLKAKLAGAVKGTITGGKNGAAMAKKNGNSKGAFTGNYKDVGKIARNGRDTIWQKGKDFMNGKKEEFYGKYGFSSVQTARANNVEGVKGELKSFYGSENGSKLIDALVKRPVFKKSDGTLTFNGNPNTDQIVNLDPGEIYKNGNLNQELFGTIKAIRGVNSRASINEIKNLGPESDEIKQMIANSLSGADDLLLSENIYKERQKQLNNISNYYQQYQTTGDSSKLSEIQSIITGNAELFTANANTGLNLGIEGISFSQYDPNDPNSLDGFIKSLDSNFKNIAKNEKALSGIQKDIQGREAVEASNGTNKDKNEGK